MTIIKPKLITDTWTSVSWDEYLQLCQDPNYEKGQFYYNNGQVRIEMSPLGSDHSRDHSTIIFALNLFATLKGINLDIHDNCTYRITGYIDAQPDISCYVGEQAEIIPWGTSIINLEQYPAPNLVIEVANSSLSDDKGEKRIIYENINVNEYWIIDVKNVKIIAFSIKDGGSKQIAVSEILPRLEFALLEEALRKNRQANHSQVGAWLLKQFQSEN